MDDTDINHDKLEGVTRFGTEALLKALEFKFREEMAMPQAGDGSQHDGIINTVCMAVIMSVLETLEEACGFEAVDELLAMVGSLHDDEDEPGRMPPTSRAEH